MGVKDELALAALARALVRTGMYVDAGIDTSAGLDKPQVYAAALLNDPDLAADGLHFVMVEHLEGAARPSPEPSPSGLREALEAIADELAGHRDTLVSRDGLVAAIRARAAATPDTEE